MQISEPTLDHFSSNKPMSFAETWISNGERNPNRMLRNAVGCYIPAHPVEFVKRLPLFSFPAAWNNAPGEKLKVPSHQIRFA
jgi:hypothetical protein